MISKLNVSVSPECSISPTNRWSNEMAVNNSRGSSRSMRGRNDRRNACRFFCVRVGIVVPNSTKEHEKLSEKETALLGCIIQPVKPHLEPHAADAVGVPTAVADLTLHFREI